MNESQPPIGENLDKKPDLSKEKPKGRRICAWCKKDLGPAETEEDTHGMCEECLAKFLKENET